MEKTSAPDRPPDRPPGRPPDRHIFNASAQSTDRRARDRPPARPADGTTSRLTNRPSAPPARPTARGSARARARACTTPFPCGRGACREVAGEPLAVDLEPEPSLATVESLLLQRRSAQLPRKAGAATSQPPMSFQSPALLVRPAAHTGTPTPPKLITELTRIRALPPTRRRITPPSPSPSPMHTCHCARLIARRRVMPPVLPICKQKAPSKVLTPPRRLRPSLPQVGDLSSDMSLALLQACRARHTKLSSLT